jgi:small conductance mechanosensitive channel
MKDPHMETQLNKIDVLRDVMLNNGLELALALVILIVGLVLVRHSVRWLRTILSKTTATPVLISTICNSIGVLIIMVIIVAASVQLGNNPKPIMRLMMIIALAAIGIIVLFRPFLPTLPFKVGNTVKIGDLLGKVEATTILNTRIKTFDGRTFYVPNRKILDDIVINYHYTDTRRVKIDIGIRYDQDLLKAKQVMETIMTEDPRVLPKPTPAVWVLKLTPNAVELGARCWTSNAHFWMTKVELTEKFKLRFDTESIAIAHTQVDIHHFTHGAPWSLKRQEWGNGTEEQGSIIADDDDRLSREHR